MSRRLETLKEKYIADSSLTSLIEYLEECKKEKLWETIIETVENWNGSETPEIHFYNGIALLNLGKRAEGAELLKKVVQHNPNHFAARKEIENFGLNETDQISAREATDALKKILIIEPKVDNTEYSRNLKYKNLAFVFVIAGAVIFLANHFLREDKSDIYRQMLKDPLSSFTSISYGDYVTRVRELKITDIREDIGEPVKKCILWITALAVADFHLDTEKEDFSHFKMYSTLVSGKERELKEIVDYIETGAVAPGTELFHKFDAGYPDSKQQIERLDIEPPSAITRSNVRDAFYRSLMLFRKSEFEQAGALIDRILSAFPDYELAQKLKIMIKAKAAVAAEAPYENIEGDLAVLDKWKTLSQERYFFGEAKTLLGTAAKRDDIISDGFYSVCPGRYFCNDTVRYFMNKGATAEASRMALFMKEQKENKREAGDIKLVLETSYADGDYSNCYFAFRELAQFFKNDVDEKTLLKGGECSEKNGYFEEAVAVYEEINKKNPDIVITSKILRMKYRLTEEELYYTQLKDLANKNGENLSVLYSYLDILKKRGVIDETISVLEKLYDLESPENKFKMIEEYLRHGAVFQAVTNLEKMKEQKPAAKLLSEIYNRYMLFDKADAVLPSDETINPLWIFFKEQMALKNSGEYEIVSKELEKRMASLERCEPAFIYLKGETYRNLGDKQRTFSMIDALLECNPYYMPGLVLASEITYYQGDFTKAKEGINYLLENEKYLSPGRLYYHNYLVLLNAEIMVAEGREGRLIGYLKKELIRDIPFGSREVEKIEDISEKLKEQKQVELKNFLKKNFKFSTQLTEQ